MKKILTFLVSCLMLFTCLFAFPFPAKAAISFENAKELSLDKNYLVKITDKNDYGFFKFTPTETAVYSFASSEDDAVDGYCELFDASGNFLTYSDDCNNCEFNIIYTLQAGKTYYFTPHTYYFKETNTSINVKLTKTDIELPNIITDAKVTLPEQAVQAYFSEDNKSDLYLYTYISYDITGTTLQLSFADGTTENYTHNGSNFVNTDDPDKTLDSEISESDQFCDAINADKYDASLYIPYYHTSVPLSLDYSPKVKSFTYTPKDADFSVIQTQQPRGEAAITAADIVVTYMDGTQKIFSNNIDSNYTDNCFKNIENLDESYYLSVSGNCDFSKVGTASVQMGFIDKIETISVNVSDSTSELQSFTFTPDKEIKIAEASYYYATEWYNNVTGTITITKKDGSIETFTGSPGSNFKDTNDNIMPYKFSCNYADCEEWKAGQNSYRFYLENLVCSVPVTILSITNATFAPDEPIILLDSGSYSTSEFYGNVEGKITLSFSDGTQKTYSGKAYNDFKDENNTFCPLHTSCNYNDTNNWDVGSDNYYNFRIGSFTCPVQVTIKHNLHYIGEKPATCTANGYTDYSYCSYCDYKTESTVIPATGHIDEDNDYVCDTCNTAFDFNVKQPVDVRTVCNGSATFTTDTSAADCTYQWYKAGSIIEGANDKVLTLENVTYASHNLTTYYCVVTNSAGKSVTTSSATLYVSHDFTSETVTKAPTCTRYGEKEMTCACGTKETFDVKPSGHSYVTTGVVPATCTEEGYTGDEACENCGRIKNGGSAIPVIEHNPVSASNAVAPTCTTAGKESDIICASCHSVLTKGKEISATGHDFGENGPVCQICKTENPDYKAPDDNPGTEPTTQEKINELAKKYGISAKTLALTEEKITAAKGNSDLAGAEYKKLKLKQKSTTKTSISISWSKVSGADGYVVYANTYGSKLKKVATLSNRVTYYTHKRLKANKYYKYVVIAYKNVDNQRITLSASKTIFVTTKNGKYDNPKALKVAKSRLSVKKGKKATIRVSQAKTKKKMKKLTAIRFESSNTKIATVSSKGVVKGIKKGSCTIYVYAQNGLAKTVKISVK